MSKIKRLLIAAIIITLFAAALAACDFNQQPKVIFRVDGLTYKTVQIKPDASMPAVPTKVGYTFDGWFLDDTTFEEPFNGFEGLTKSVIVYAKWTPWLPGDAAVKLATPANLSIDEASAILMWSNIPHSGGYTVDINGQQYNIATNSFSLAYLNSGTYTIKVRAFSAYTINYEDSDWSEAIEYQTMYQDGLIYKLINDDTEYEVASKGNATGDIFIGGYYLGKPVTSIGENAFANASRVTTMVIGNNVKNIGRGAFYNCVNLTSVMLPESVTSLGERAFSTCRNLTSITLPDGLTTIDSYCFAYCRSLESVIIPDSVTVMREFAFLSCTGLKSVTLGSSLTSVNQYVFSGCAELNTISKGDNITSIGENAFYDCAKLFEFRLPALASIGGKAFLNCTALASITIPDSVTSVGEAAFYNTAIWNNAGDIVYADKWVVGCKNNTELRAIILKDGTVGISDSAFYNCNNLESIAIPDSVAYIGKGAFSNCVSLKTITIPAAVKEIGASAFFDCIALTDIYVTALTSRPAGWDINWKVGCGATVHWGQ